MRRELSSYDGHHPHWMRRCLLLAARGAGSVSPNPLVGAVIVGKGGVALGEGWHGRFGGPHAEVYAIREALRKHEAGALKEATLYVNLEPCSHEGKTPPCADLIINHGIPRVIVGAEDPHPVFGKGAGRLREAGVQVETGILGRECARLNEAFFHYVRTSRPLVTLKIAQTLDGKVAGSGDKPRWISCEKSRALVHRWRAALDGVLVGRGAAEADDPALTVRHIKGRQPQRFVLDRKGTLPSSLRLFSDKYADHTTAIVGEGAHPEYQKRLATAGGRLWRLPVAGGHLDLDAVLDRMGAEGGPGGRAMNSLMVEAGPGLATALLNSDLADRVYIFTAPKIMGSGVPALPELNISGMDEMLTFKEHTWTQCGEDILFRGHRRSYFI